MNNNDAAPILAVIKACDATILATYNGEHPDLRHISNAMNLDAADFNLFFMTSHETPKYTQLCRNNACALYYYDDKTRHAVRLYGKMEFIHDIVTRRKYWRPEFEKFGYGGPESSEFILMKFIPATYKYYIGPEIKTGNI